jgi:hypothetical protein
MRWIGFNLDAEEDVRTNKMYSNLIDFITLG